MWTRFPLYSLSTMSMVVQTGPVRWVTLHLHKMAYFSGRCGSLIVHVRKLQCMVVALFPGYHSQHSLTVLAWKGKPWVSISARLPYQDTPYLHVLACMTIVTSQPFVTCSHTTCACTPHLLSTIQYVENHLLRPKTVQISCTLPSTHLDNK